MEARRYADPALVISECQRGLVDPEVSFLPQLADQVEGRGILRRTAALAAAFRRCGRPVIHCHLAHRADMAGVVPNSLLAASARKHARMVVGTVEVEPAPPLVPEPSDLVSRRSTGLTAFYGTDLDVLLRTHRVRTVVLAGVSTNIALPGAALEAVNRGFDVVLAEDCSAGASSTEHAFMVDNVLSLVARIDTADRIAADL